MTYYLWAPAPGESIDTMTNQQLLEHAFDKGHRLVATFEADSIEDARKIWQTIAGADFRAPPSGIVGGCSENAQGHMILKRPKEGRDL